MSARRESYCVSLSDQGWVVHAEGGGRRWGPFVDKERAIAVALATVREAKPSQLRISNAVEEWRVEFVRTSRGTALLPEQEPALSGTGPELQGVAHVSP